MADELRIPAEVVDRFSAPLKAFRAELLGTGKQGAEHTEHIAKGFNKVEGALQVTARTASTVLNPALAALGVTGLGVGAAVAGIAGAMRSLSGNLTALGQLSRETGVAADTLRTFGAVAGKFNVDQEAVASGTKSFVANLREFRMHGNETFAWLQSQGRTAEGRSIFQGLAKDLRSATDAGEAMQKVIKVGEGIADPTEKKMFFQRMFGSEDWARFADGHLGKFADVYKGVKDRLPPLDPKAILKAEEFERAVADLRGSMKSIGTTIATEVLPLASDLTKWIDDIVKDQRGDFMKGLREGLAGVSAELRGIDWKSVGDNAKSVLKGIFDRIAPLAAELRKTVELIHALKTGDTASALRITTGGKGTIGEIVRQIDPRAGDDETAMQVEIDALKRRLDRPTVDFESGATVDLSSQDPAVRKRLVEAEAELSRLKARSPEQRKADFDASMEKLRKAVESNTDEMKRRAGDATAQKSSAEGDGPFGGAHIQSATFGGGGFRRFGGGSGPGYSGEQGERGAMREQFRQHLLRTVPGYDGGDTVPIPPGGRVPSMGGSSPRLPGLRSSGSATGVPDGVEMTDAERNTLGLIMKYESHGQNTMNYEGKRQGLDPNTAKGYTAQGYYQILNSNWRKLAPGLGIKTSNAMSASLEDQTRVALALLRASRGNPKDWAPFNPALRAAIARGERAPVASIPRSPNIEAPGGATSGGDADFFPNGAPRVITQARNGGFKRRRS